MEGEDGDGKGNCSSGGSGLGSAILGERAKSPIKKFGPGIGRTNSFALGARETDNVSPKRHGRYIIVIDLDRNSFILVNILNINITNIIIINNINY